MAVFKIGQRVRVVNAKYNGAALNGTETRVIGIGDPFGTIGPMCGGKWYELDIPCALTGRQWFGCRCTLEPTVDDGRKVIAWAECKEWQPEREREEVGA